MKKKTTRTRRRTTTAASVHTHTASLSPRDPLWAYGVPIGALVTPQCDFDVFGPSTHESHVSVRPPSPAAAPAQAPYCMENDVEMEEAGSDKENDSGMQFCDEDLDFELFSTEALAADPYTDAREAARFAAIPLASIENIPVPELIDESVAEEVAAEDDDEEEESRSGHGLCDGSASSVGSWRPTNETIDAPLRLDGPSISRGSGNDPSLSDCLSDLGSVATLSDDDVGTPGLTVDDRPHRPTGIVVDTTGHLSDNSYTAITFYVKTSDVGKVRDHVLAFGGTLVDYSERRVLSDGVGGIPRTLDYPCTREFWASNEPRCLMTGLVFEAIFKRGPLPRSITQSYRTLKNTDRHQHHNLVDFSSLTACLKKNVTSLAKVGDCVHIGTLFDSDSRGAPHVKPVGMLVVPKEEFGRKDGDPYGVLHVLHNGAKEVFERPLELLCLYDVVCPKSKLPVSHENHMYQCFRLVSDEEAAACDVDGDTGDDHMDATMMVFEDFSSPLE